MNKKTKEYLFFLFLIIFPNIVIAVNGFVMKFGDDKASKEYHFIYRILTNSVCSILFGCLLFVIIFCVLSRNYKKSDLLGVLICLIVFPIFCLWPYLFGYTLNSNLISNFKAYSSMHYYVMLGADIGLLISSQMKKHSY